MSPQDVPPRSPPLPPFELPVRVYYEDTDAAGVVYYANYLRFCERARTEWLRRLGFSQQALREQDGLVFVVRSVQLDYLAPAVLDDALVVSSSIERLARASIVFRQRVLRGAQCLCEARVTIASVEAACMKPVALPGAIRERFLNPAEIL